MTPPTRMTGIYATQTAIINIFRDQLRGGGIRRRGTGGGGGMGRVCHRAIRALPYNQEQVTDDERGDIRVFNRNNKGFC